MITSDLTRWPVVENGSGDDVVAQLVQHLSAEDTAVDESGTWPADAWTRLCSAGANLWAIPEDLGGLRGDRAALLTRYGRVAEGSLTVAFILTQHDAAVRRLAVARRRGHAAAEGWLRRIASGNAFTTVGLSQLTTSRRHGDAALRVAADGGQGNYVVDGIIPWVTGARQAHVVVAGAALGDGRQLLFALPMNRPGVSVGVDFALAALQASCTAEIRCEHVSVEADDVLSGPSEDVMATPGTAGTGGLETSALALGQARAAIEALARDTQSRGEERAPTDALAARWALLADQLLAGASDAPAALPPAELRRRANELVLNATQAYLTARKGTGFLRSEVAQRWARQALFFLVWSCPTPVARAAIRGLAGVCES